MPPFLTFALANYSFWFVSLMLRSKQILLSPRGKYKQFVSCCHSHISFLLPWLSHLVIQVIVAGVPKPVVQWLRDGKELKKGKRILLEEELVPEGVKYKMTIRDIVMKDFGTVSQRFFFGRHPGALMTTLSQLPSGITSSVDSLVDGYTKPV